MSDMWMGCGLEDGGVTVGVIWVKGGEAVSSVRPGPHEGLETEGFRTEVREDIERMSRDDIRLGKGGYEGAGQVR